MTYVERYADRDELQTRLNALRRRGRLHRMFHGMAEFTADPRKVDMLKAAILFTCVGIVLALLFVDGRGVLDTFAAWRSGSL